MVCSGARDRIYYVTEFFLPVWPEIIEDVKQEASMDEIIDVLISENGDGPLSSEIRSKFDCLPKTWQSYIITKLKERNSTVYKNVFEAKKLKYDEIPF